MLKLPAISAIFTGTKRKKHLLEGHQVKYKYSGKFIQINPFEMVREICNLLIEDDSSMPTEDPSQFESASTKYFPEFDQKFKNHTSCRMEVGELVVVRRVNKLGKIQHSRYDFYLDSELLGYMIRRYDFGRDFATIGSELSSQVGVPSKSSDYSLHWNSPDQQHSLINFGHTHLYAIKDKGKMRKLGKKE